MSGYDVNNAFKNLSRVQGAGVSDEQAQEAAEELAGYEKRLIRLEVMTALTLAGVTGLVLGVASLVIKAFL